MQIQDYVKKSDTLAFEDMLYNTPLRKEYILARIGSGKRVLDVGCLGGRISRSIMEQNNEVWGIEINRAAAALAEKRGIRVKVSNVEDGLSFADSTFDVVHAGEIIEQLYDTKLFFHESFRVLKKGGLLLFTVPNLNSIENRLRVATGGYLSMAGAYPEDHCGEHIRVFNISKLRDLCEQTGFQVLDLSGILNLEPYGRLIDWPLRWVGKILPSFSKMLMVTARKK